MKPRLWKLFAATIAAAALFPVQAAAQDVIKIGVTQPLTGAFAASGNYVAQGAKIAEDHVNKAIDCAEAIRVLTEEMRRRPGFVEHGFGRTRIGIETGIAVLGEVGAGGKLDYTAHGDAINLAARLQEANKFLGTAICVGPEASVQSGRKLRSVGMHEIRGFGEMELFTTEA